MNCVKQACQYTTETAHSRTLVIWWMIIIVWLQHYCTFLTLQLNYNKLSVYF